MKHSGFTIPAKHVIIPLLRWGTYQERHCAFRTNRICEYETAAGTWNPTRCERVRMRERYDFIT